MGLSVCPMAIVAAPVETVWELLTDFTHFDAWADAQTERIEPEGPAAAGQTVYLKASALGRAWHVTFHIQAVNAEKHQLRFLADFPLGIHLQENLQCVPIDATSCRVQYG